MPFLTFFIKILIARCAVVFFSVFAFSFFFSVDMGIYESLSIFLSELLFKAIYSLSEIHFRDSIPCNERKTVSSFDEGLLFDP